MAGIYVFAFPHMCLFTCPGTHRGLYLRINPLTQPPQPALNEQTFSGLWSPIFMELQNQGFKERIYARNEYWNWLNNCEKGLNIKRNCLRPYDGQEERIKGDKVWENSLTLSSSRVSASKSWEERFEAAAALYLSKPVNKHKSSIESKNLKIILSFFSAKNIFYESFSELLSRLF